MAHSGLLLFQHELQPIGSFGTLHSPVDVIKLPEASNTPNIQTKTRQTIHKNIYGLVKHVSCSPYLAKYRSGGFRTFAFEPPLHELLL